MNEASSYMLQRGKGEHKRTAINHAYKVGEQKIPLSFTRLFVYAVLVIGTIKNTYK